MTEATPLKILVGIIAVCESVMLCYLFDPLQRLVHLIKPEWWHSLVLVEEWRMI